MSSILGVLAQLATNDCSAVAMLNMIRLVGLCGEGVGLLMRHDCLGIPENLILIQGCICFAD